MEIIMENKEMSFEELLQELDKAVEKLESKDLSLDEAIETYKKGLELSNKIKTVLENAKNVIVTKMEDK